MINNPAIMIYMENIDDKVNVSVLYNEPNSKELWAKIGNSILIIVVIGSMVESTPLSHIIDLN